MRARSGYAEIVTCALTWGSIGAIVKQITLSSPVIAFFRLLFGMLVVAGWMAARGRLGELRPHARPGLLVASGVTLGVHWLLLFEAFQRLDVAPTILIVFLGPVLFAVAAPLVLDERLRPLSVGALLVSFGGIALISVPQIGEIDRWGLASALGSAVLFAVLVLSSKVLTRHYIPSVLAVWQLAVASVMLSPALLGAAGAEVARGLPLLLLLGGLYTGVLGILYFRAVRALEVQRLGVLYYLEPASAIVYAAVLLGERPAALTLAGGALIVAAGLAIIVNDRTAVAPAGLPEPAAADPGRPS